MRQNTETPTAPPVKVAALALELEAAPDALVREIGAENVFMAGGFRCVTAFRAREMAEAHHAKKEKAAEVAARNEEQVKKTVREAHARIPKGFQKFEIATARIEPAGDGVPAAARMMAQADPPDYDGATMTRRPSKFDWLTGKGDDGATIGPSREEIQAAGKKRGKKRGKK